MRRNSGTALLWCVLVRLLWLAGAAEVDNLQSSMQPAPIPNARLVSSNTIVNNNKQTAPYAIADQDAKSEKNVVLHLALNQTVASPSGLDIDKQRWHLVDENGSRLAEKGVSFELNKLIETLNSNNITSEVRFDNYRPGMVNITISNWRREHGQDESSRGLLGLEDLLDESKFEPSLNLSSVVRDNHRLVTRQPARSKPSVGPLTVPPLRRTLDVVAENYTTKKIASEANIFALKLLEQLNIERLGNENLIHSPFAIYQGLALLLSGSAGETSRELDRLLLSLQSVYENTKLTHDQDRARLMASFGDVVRQLQLSSTNHLQTGGAFACPSGDIKAATDTGLNIECGELSRALDQVLYRGGSEEQHFIVANNLLFSPAAFEISNEFKSSLSTYFNNTALTKVEVGSTESVQVINGWIRQATAGLIPSIIGKRSTFDEFNVMTLLSTSWLAQEWRNTFRRIASPLRSNIRLKGQSIIRGARNSPRVGGDEPLMEFVDDQRNSHFVEYIQSEPTRHIHNYHAYLNKQLVDVVVVPFRNSHQRLVALTPLVAPTTNGPSILAHINSQLVTALNHTSDLNNDLDQYDSANKSPQQVPAESSHLSKMIANFASEPRRTLRQLWNTIAPEIITKQTLQSMQTASRPNSSSFNGSDSILSIPMPPKVQLSMPLMRLNADATVSAALNHVGLVNAFDQAQANFIGINGHPFNYNKLHLSNVLYKTTFNLNEAGINYDRTVRTLESMRVSPERRVQSQLKQEMDLEEGELINEVYLDKPFMFLICDIRTRLILYTGVVRNPAL